MNTTSKNLQRFGVATPDQISRLVSVEKAIANLESLGYEIPNLDFRGVYVLKSPFPTEKIDVPVGAYLPEVSRAKQNDGYVTAAYSTIGLGYVVKAPLWVVEAEVSRIEKIIALFIQGGKTARTDMGLIVAEFNLRCLMGENDSYRINKTAFDSGAGEWYPGKSSSIPPMWHHNAEWWLMGHQFAALSGAIQAMM